MNIPAWQIFGWPVVDVSIERWAELSDFELVGHSSRCDADGRRLGETLWTTDMAGKEIGLAWEWCEVQPNVIVMSDPMSVMSNVALTSTDRKTNEFERVLHLNNAIYQLPWQRRLVSILRQEEHREIPLPLAA